MDHPHRKNYFDFGPVNEFGMEKRLKRIESQLEITQNQTQVNLKTINTESLQNERCFKQVFAETECNKQLINGLLEEKITLLNKEIASLKEKLQIVIDFLETNGLNES